MDFSEKWPWLERAVFWSLLFYAFSSSISIAGSNIAVSLALLLAAIRLAVKPSALAGRTFDRRLAAVILIYMATLLLAAVFAHEREAAFLRLWSYLYRMAPLFLAAAFIRTEEQLRRSVDVMVLSICIASLYAVWQGWHGNLRAAAFSSHPMIFAGYLVQMLPFMLVMLTENTGISLLTARSYRAVLALSLLAAVYNGTRGMWIAVLSTLILYAGMMLRVRKGRTAVALLLILVLMAGLAWCWAPGVKDRVRTIFDLTYQSNSERVLLWNSAWNMFLDHPLTGAGLDNFGDLYRSQYISPQAVERGLGHAHNNFLHMLAETGVIGLTAFCVLFGYILYANAVMIGRGGRRGAWGMIGVLTTIALLCQGLTEFNYGDSAVIRMFWFILGLVQAAATLDQKEDGQT